MSEAATIFVVDPDDDANATVRAIANEMQVQCEAFVRAEDFLAAYGENRPGCLVTEFRLLGMSGIELQEHLATDCIALPIVFVTAHPEIRLTVRAMQNGAITVLEKPVSPQDLWDSVRRALAKDERTRRIDSKHSDVRSRIARLTPKERQVLDLMIQGKANKVIASRLDVSLRTVEARRHQIYRKTRTESVAELVKLILMSDVSDDPVDR